jgi:hypothetical protein
VSGQERVRALAGERAERQAELRSRDRRALGPAEAKTRSQDLDDRRVAGALGIGLAPSLQPADVGAEAVAQLDLDP